MSRQQLYCDLPAELAEADELLKRYGRWAMDRSKPQRCASAEGSYKAPPNDDDRQPREVIMATVEVDRVRQALDGLPTVTRTVVLWLYVPDREPLPVKVRRCGVPPRILRERHLDGVRQFWKAWLGFAPITNVTLAKRSIVVENCTT